MSNRKPGAPKYFTRRNPARPTLGGLVNQVSKIVRGYELMPWQQYVANVAWELDPEYPGELYYTEGDITVPRQAGKSDLLEAFHITGALIFKGWHSNMTAQTGKDAGKRWSQLVENLGLIRPNRAADWKILKGKGMQSAVYLPQLGTIAPFPPTPDAIHGDHTNFASIDEYWAFTLEEGDALETAIKPTFSTVKFTQLIRASTMGTANSTYMNRNLEIGRLATLDPGARRFYFEWSADEEEADKNPYSDATLSFHPAIGYTQSARKIRDLGGDMNLGQWRRSFLNLLTQTDETVIDLAKWDSLRWNYDNPAAQTPRYRPARPEDQIIIWDIANSGESATILAAWLTPDGTPAIELIATDAGTYWMPETLKTLAAKPYRAILADEAGPNKTMLQELAAQHIPTTPVTYAQYSHACQSFFDRVRTGDLEHDGHSLYPEQIKSCTVRDSGKYQIFDIRKSAGPLDALRAAAIGQDAAMRLLSTPILQIF